MPAFSADYRADQEVEASVQERQNTEEAQLLIPRLAALWTTGASSPKFESIAAITHGLYFLPKTHPAFPRGAVTVLSEPSPGLVEGFSTAIGGWETHLTPKPTWLNLNPVVIEWPMEGTTLKKTQVLMNHGRASRQVWRHKAFIDSAGRPFTHRFIVFRPMGRYPLELLWALCNSPYANAYTFTDSGKRDLSATFLRQMPIPDLGKSDTRPLVSAVRAYLTAARRFSEIQSARPAQPKRRGNAGRAAESAAKLQLELGGIELDEPQAEAAAREHLRALHWRVDAEVLNLYALPAALERELLDFFDGVRRVGVPFEQKGYIPAGFREVQRLEDFLRITDEWEQTDDRRCYFIEMRVQRGRRTADEEKEFKSLQRLYDLRRAYCRWQRTGDANSPLIDEAMFKRLREEDAKKAHAR